MKVITFASAKGGSGKTILAITLANAAASLGFRCLIVDADASTNGMTLFHLEQVVKIIGDRPLGLFDLAARSDEPADHTTLVELQEGLFLLPATFAAFDTQKTDADEFHSVLTKELARIKESKEFDFILCDAQAGVDHHAIAAIEVCDQLVIVSEYDPVSARGVERMKLLVSNVSDPDSTWVLFNKVLPEFAGKLGDFLAITNHLPPILWTADVVRSYVRSEIALNLKQPNTFTLGLLETASVVFGQDMRKQIEHWREETREHLGGSVKDAIVRVEDRIAEIRKESTKRRLFDTLQDVSPSLLIVSMAGYFIFAQERVSTLMAGFLGGVALIVAISGFQRSFFRRIESKDDRLATLHDQLENLHATERASLDTLVARSEANQ